MREVESFKLDHTTFVAPYVKVVERFIGLKGDVVTKYEIRLVHPEDNSVSTEALQTLVNHIEGYIRDCLKESIINVSPMDCRSGFYLTIYKEKEIKEIQEIIISILERILDEEEDKEYAKDVLEEFRGKRI